MTVQKITPTDPDKMVPVTVLVPLKLRTRLNVAVVSRNTSVQKLLTPTIQNLVDDLEQESSSVA